MDKEIRPKCAINPAAWTPRRATVCASVNPGFGDAVLGRAGAKMVMCCDITAIREDGEARRPDVLSRGCTGVCDNRSWD